MGFLKFQAAIPGTDSNLCCGFQFSALAVVCRNRIIEQPFLISVRLGVTSHLGIKPIPPVLRGGCHLRLGGIAKGTGTSICLKNIFSLLVLTGIYNYWIFFPGVLNKWKNIVRFARCSRWPVQRWPVQLDFKWSFCPSED